MPRPKVSRVPKPTTHATGKPIRGIGAGRRGPNKTFEERELEKDPGQRPIQITYRLTSQKQLDAQTAISKNTPPQTQAIVRTRTRASKELQQLIQLVGDERIDPGSLSNQWTRIEAVVRRLFADALSGKQGAAHELFERGWGKVAAPIKLDFTAEMRRVFDESGLTEDDIESDPLLRKLITSGAGQIVENDSDGQNPESNQ